MAQLRKANHSFDEQEGRLLGLQLGEHIPAAAPGPRHLTMRTLLHRWPAKRLCNGVGGGADVKALWLAMTAGSRDTIVAVTPPPSVAVG